MSKLSKQSLISESWRRGILTFKLSPEQKDLYDLFYKSDYKVITLLLSRRFGKSHFLCLVGIEQCLRKKNSIVKFIAPTKTQVDKIIRPIMRRILEDCPEDLSPRFDKKDYIYFFPNGSEIQIAGIEGGHAEGIRGGDSDLFFVDEAQSCSQLKYVMNSILLPTTLTTKGRGILAGTPPRESDHEFLEYIENGELKNSLLIRTIDTITRVTKEEKEKLIEEAGGINSEEVQREFYCKIIKDPTTSVIPEFTKELEKEIIKECPIPPYYHSFVGMDVGTIDLTALVFGYYDFRAGKIIIQDELIVDFKLKDNNLQTLTDAILLKEKTLWTNPLTKELQPPLLRVSDIDYTVIKELGRLSNNKLYFQPADKHGNELAINNLRLLLGGKKIMIHPRCTTLIRHLRNVKWNKSKKDFARSADDSHYDTCFIENQQILTSIGYKNIQDINPGDMVLTHKDRFRKVLSTMKKEYNGNLNSIKVDGRKNIICTPEHPFYVGKLERNFNSGYTGQLTLKNNEWVSSNNLNPLIEKLYIPTISNIIFNKKNISLEMCFLYGYWVAEGSLGCNKYQISFAGHKKEINVIKILEKAIFDKYGKGCSGKSIASFYRHKSKKCIPRNRKIRLYNNLNDNSRRININQKELWNELKLLGKSDYKKFPDWFINLNVEQSFYMLCGYFFGDGCFSKKGIRSSTISENINNSIDILARKCGFIGNKRLEIKKELNKVINNKKCKVKEKLYIYNLDLFQSITFYNKIQENELLKFVFLDKLIRLSNLKRIQNYPFNYKSFKKEIILNFSGFVYNLEVEEDNSYTINDISVHNCKALQYMVRHIDLRRNPYPAHFDLNVKDLYVRNPEKFESNQNQIEIFRKILNRKPRKY